MEKVKPGSKPTRRKLIPNQRDGLGWKYPVSDKPMSERMCTYRRAERLLQIWWKEGLIKRHLH